VAGSTPTAYYNVAGRVDDLATVIDAQYNFVAAPTTPFVVGGIGWSWADSNIADGSVQVGRWWSP
jgi:hypothetical protein